jgi:hypothetical protein
VEVIVEVVEVLKVFGILVCAVVVVIIPVYEGRKIQNFIIYQ